jgi:hypothetical protein
VIVLKKVLSVVVALMLVMMFCASAYATPELEERGLQCVTIEGELSIVQTINGASQCVSPLVAGISLIDQDQAIEVYASTPLARQYYELSFESTEGEFYHIYNHSDDQGMIHDVIYPSEISVGNITIYLGMYNGDKTNFSFFKYPVKLVKF